MFALNKMANELFKLENIIELKHVTNMICYLYFSSKNMIVSSYSLWIN